MKWKALKSLSGALSGLGCVFLISPPLLYWFIHGDYVRYIWLINGPYPFSRLGGGPFQLFLYLGMVLAGIGLLAVSRLVAASIRHTERR